MPATFPSSSTPLPARRHSIDGLLAIAGIVAISGGLLAGLASPIWLLAAGALTGALWFCAAWPLPGVLLGLALVFDLLPAQLLPSLNLAHGTVKLYDLWFAGLAVPLLWRACFKPKIQPITQTVSQPMSQPISQLGILPVIPPVIPPLMQPVLQPVLQPDTNVALHRAIWFLMSLTLISFLYSHVYLGNKGAVSEARELLLWLLLPLLMRVLDRPQRLKVFLAGLLWIGVAVSLLALAQSLLGMQLSKAMRIVPLNAEFQDVTRVITGGGIYITAFALIYYIVQSFSPARRPWWLWPVMSVLLAGLVVTFGRGIWMATCIGLLVALTLAHGWRRAALASLAGAAMLTLVLAGLSVLKPALMQASIDRGMGISAEFATGGSFKWRSIENQEALQSIAARPLLGVGIGGDYKKHATSDANFDIEKRYIHNAYLYFPLKFGIVGILFPVLILAIFFRLARRAWQGPSPQRGLLAATIGAFMVPMITSLTQPEWVKVQGIAALCCFIALLWAAERQARQEALQ